VRANGEFEVFESASVTSMPSSDDIYTAPVADVTYDLVRQFVLYAEEANLFSESLTFEAKERRNGINVAKAVAALSNTDGGIVLVGVKDTDATGEDRIVGVPKTELTAVVTTLRSQIPEAIPEIIPVRIPGTEQLILVLRVHADDVPHPVVVDGTVYYRLPEQSARADRRRVWDLVARDQAGAAAQRGKMDVPIHSGQAAHLPLWPDEMDKNLPHPAITGTLRVVGGLILPRRILDRPWLDSRARQAALDALNNSPLRRNPGWATTTWTVTEARATYLRLHAGTAEFGTYRAECAAYLSLAGRKLSLIAGFRWLKHSDAPNALSPEDFYWALLGSMITIASTCGYVARKIDAAEPADTDSWEAWLQPDGESSVSEAVSLSRFERDNASEPNAGYFPPARTQGCGIEELDELARNWLTYWVLDMGLRDAETWFADRKRPDFLRIPDLA
jgi:Putative DNA-binding domain